MALYYNFRCPLPNGLHARPASRLAELVQALGCNARLTNLRSGVCANAASVLELLASGTLFGDPCDLELPGEAGEQALSALARFIEEEWPQWDAGLAAAPTGSGRLPRPLLDVGAECLAGLPLSSGVCSGRVVALRSTELPRGDFLPGSPDEEGARLAEALAAAAADLKQAIELAEGQGGELLRASLALLSDPALGGEMQRLVEAGAAAEQAVRLAVESYAARLEAAPSAYLQERCSDLLDIGIQLCEALGVEGAAAALPELERPSIIAARSLAPRQLLALDKSRLLGLVLTEAGPTSHAAILARALGIPAISGIAPAQIGGSATALLDGRRGLLYLNPNAAVRRFYEKQAGWEARRQRASSAALPREARSADGRRIEISANVASLAQLPLLAAQGAEGIGLLRTELLLADYDQAPGEEEQYRLYREFAEALAPWPVIVRTLDIGGDKPLPWVALPREPNPFLGYRGLRIYRDHPALLGTQLRAILRAAAHGKLRVMAPMVTNLAEAAWFRQQVEEARVALSLEGRPAGEDVQVGAMIEVPSAALAVSALASGLDFFSLGSNDLSQYCMAADRGNARVSALADECEPAFLRLLKTAVDAAHAAGRWIGLCGEMAGKPELLPLLLGLGLDELSMDAARIAPARSAIAGLTAGDCRAVLERALACPSAEAVRALLHETRPQGRQPLLDPGLVDLAADCRSKTEVLSQCAGMLYAAGRCEDADAFEEALWAREAAFSTALGGGFAVPHCKSDAVAAASLAVLRLLQPVDWGAEDGLPVHTAIMLAFRDDGGQDHLRVFARLARRLVHEEFRAALLAADSPAALQALLRSELDIE